VRSAEDGGRGEGIHRDCLRGRAPCSTGSSSVSLSAAGSPAHDRTADAPASGASAHTCSWARRNAGAAERVGRGESGRGGGDARDTVDIVLDVGDPVTAIAIGIPREGAAGGKAGEQALPHGPTMGATPRSGMRSGTRSGVRWTGDMTVAGSARNKGKGSSARSEGTIRHVHTRVYTPNCAVVISPTLPLGPSSAICRRRHRRQRSKSGVSAARAPCGSARLSRHLVAETRWTASEALECPAVRTDEEGTRLGEDGMCCVRVVQRVQVLSSETLWSAGSEAGIPKPRRVTHGIGRAAGMDVLAAPKSGFEKIENVGEKYKRLRHEVRLCCKRGCEALRLRIHAWAKRARGEGCVRGMRVLCVNVPRMGTRGRAC
jgi:hypothetical protein